MGDVTIANTSADAFKESLQFFYLTDIELSIEYIIDILHLGLEYKVTDEDVCAVLELAIYFGHQQLVKICDAHCTHQIEYSCGK